MTHGMVMILSGLLKHVRGGLDLKRFDHILIRVGGGTGTKKNRVPYPFCEKPSSFFDFFLERKKFFLIFSPFPRLLKKKT